ncbi:gag-pol polyprotein, partial [Trifolium medium]|nr:gag-pol polyprotein [Trifolium medium]
MIKGRYLVIKTNFTSYDIIIGLPALGALRAVMSTLYLMMKYPMDYRRVGIVRGDQAIRRKCYQASLRTGSSKENRVNMAEDFADLDPREDFQEGRVSPIEELKQVLIGEMPHQVTNLGTALEPSEEEHIVSLLRRNIDLFAWHPSDTSGISESIITHKLSLFPNVKPVSQRKRRLDEKRRKAVDEEVRKLKEAGFITE